MLIRFTAALVIAALLAGCTKKELSHIGDPPTPVPMVNGHIWGLPPGITAPPGAIGDDEIDGLYPSTVPNDHMCCWVGKRSRLLVKKAAPATNLELTLFVPDYLPFRQRTQEVSVSIDGGAPERRELALGVNTLNFTLPPALHDRTGTFAVDLETAFTFVPAEIRLNRDTRRLGVVVNRVDLE